MSYTIKLQNKKEFQFFKLLILLSELQKKEKMEKIECVFFC